MGEGLEKRLVPEPGLHGRDHLGGLGAAKLGPLGLTLCTLVNLVELADPLEREMSFGMVRRGLLEFPVHVRLILRTG